MAISVLVAVDPVAAHRYEHLEYKPLVNARAHALGPVRQIVNGAFHGQYHRFLHELSYRRSLDDADQLAATYYLLLQDRAGEILLFPAVPGGWDRCSYERLLSAGAEVSGRFDRTHNSVRAELRNITAAALETTVRYGAQSRRIALAPGESTTVEWELS